MKFTTYNQLSDEAKNAVLRRLEIRRTIHQSALRGLVQSPVEIFLIGDRPGPAAPKDPTYHHTPFYSIKYCSGWLNALLEVNDIPEHKLAWLNAFDINGSSTTFNVLLEQESLPRVVILLGGNATRWYSSGVRNGVLPALSEAVWTGQIFHHPQYWKRFKSKLSYPLVDFLKKVT